MKTDNGSDSLVAGSCGKSDLKVHPSHVAGAKVERLLKEILSNSKALGLSPSLLAQLLSLPCIF